MKLCITSTGNKKDSPVDPRFGRCSYFIFYNSKKDEYKVVENTAARAARGAGVEASKIVMNENPQVIITGNIGPNASNVILNSDIKIYSVDGGTVKQAIKAFNNGNLKKIEQATVGGHFGLQDEGGDSNNTSTRPGQGAGKGQGQGQVNSKQGGRTGPKNGQGRERNS
ncbi:MAG: NifB/NifX family molybdenum-iron cluster-binding protein [Elusimicrobiota bacterium]